MLLLRCIVDGMLLLEYVCTYVSGSTAGWLVSPGLRQWAVLEVLIYETHSMTTACYILDATAASTAQVSSVSTDSACSIHTLPTPLIRWAFGGKKWAPKYVLRVLKSAYWARIGLHCQLRQRVAWSCRRHLVANESSSCRVPLHLPHIAHICGMVDATPIHHLINQHPPPMPSSTSSQMPSLNVESLEHTSRKAMSKCSV